MRFKKLINLPVIISILLSALSLNLMASTNLQLDSFEVFEVTGDIDGVEDEVFYFKAKQKILLIASEITIPIPFSDSSSFIVTTEGSIVEWISEIPESLLAPVDMEILSGDFDGDGRVDLFFKTNTVAYDSLVAFGSNGELPSSISIVTTIEGYDIYDSSVVVQDINNDGQDDLEIIFNDSQKIVAYSGSNGLFNSSRGGGSSGVIVAGGLAGDFDVSKFGSASYSIPIGVPLGGGGMQPTLSFSYDSNNGNGYMGVGWAVTNPSSITKCSTTYIDDGYIEGNKYFCLDGQRLVDRGSDTYYTANGDFTKVVKLSDTAFKAYYKSGEIAYFGDYSGSNQDAFQSKLDIWHLSKIEDRYGNARRYDYQNDESTGEHFLEAINYPGGSVGFQYSTSERLDASQSWVQGEVSTIQRLLDKVESKSDAGVYRSYVADYEYSEVSGQALLVSLRECGADGTCVGYKNADNDTVSTEFEWSGTEISGIANANSKNDTDYWYNTSDYEVQQSGHFVYDINGDGLSDIVQLGIVQNQANYNGSHYRYHFLINLGDNTFKRAFEYRARESFMPSSSLIFDMDGDGKTEMLVTSLLESKMLLLKHMDEETPYYADEVEAVPMEFIEFDRLDNAPHVLDLDGNGLPDLLTTTSNSRWNVMFNNSGQTFEAPIPIDITSKNASKARVFDFDGDGKQELLFPSDSGKWQILGMNTALGTYYLTALNASVYNSSTTRLADINADGLLDLVFKYDGHWGFSINTGNDFNDVVKTNVPYNEKAQFIDYDDNGLVDILEIKDSKWNLHQLTGGLNCFTGVSDCFSFSELDGADVLHSDGYFISGDFNGDGMTDFLSLDGTNRNLYARASVELPDYLVKVKSSYGVETEFVYDRLYDTFENLDFYDKGNSVDFPLTSLSGAMNVVKQVITHKNQSGFKDAVSYQYKNLVMHKQGLGNLGFEEVVTTGALTKTIAVYSHDISNRTQGMLAFQQVWKRENPSGSWESDVIRTNFNQSVVAQNDDRFRYTYVDRVEERSGSYPAAKTTTTEYQPDVEDGGFIVESDFGDMVTVRVTTAAYDSSSLEKTVVITNNEYQTPHISDWIVGRLIESTVSTSGSYRDGSTRESTIKTSAWEYNSNGYLSAEIIEPSDSLSDPLQKRTDYTYNHMGLKETVEVSTNNHAYPSRTTVTKYDSLGRYPVSVTDAVGTVTTHYDPVLGLPTSSEGVNNTTTHMSYDGFGRRIGTSFFDAREESVTFVNVSDSSGPAAKYSDGYPYEIAVAELPAEYYVQKTDSNGKWTRSYFDRLGNNFETHALDGFGRVVIVREEYDWYGQVLRKSDPYFDSSTSGCDDRSIEANPLCWNVVEGRDFLQRPTDMVNQEGTDTRVRYDLGSYYRNGSQVLLRGPSVQTVHGSSLKLEIYTLDGLLHQAVDADGSIVEYRYDADGNMLKMIDLVDQDGDETNDIATTLEYDVRGRKVSMNDPNKGLWQYTYNAYSELVMQEDAMGNKTCQSYDALGRMVKRIDLFNGTPQDALNFCANDEDNPETSTWIYDTAANGKGKLHEVYGPSGYREKYTYDTYGRLSEELKMIRNKDGVIESFVTKVEYDNQSRPVKTVYPSGMDVESIYNEFGALIEIRKGDDSEYYWKLLSTNARGQSTTISLADGEMVTDKSYSPERGFVESITTTASMPGDLQQEWAQYDHMGNVEYRRDEIANSEETAFYDSLNRLDYIKRRVNGGAETTEDFEYSYNGNILSKSGVSGLFQYGQECNGVTPGHNALTTANNKLYCYDLNGNMVSDGERSIHWSSFGKPVSFSRGDNLNVTFQYGPNRKRIKRIDTSSGNVTETTYIGPYEKVVTGAVVEERHYIGGVAVITRLSTGGSTTTKENYLLKDNLGSVVTAIDIDELKAQSSLSIVETAFDPWGKRRHSNWNDFLTDNELYDYSSNVTNRGYTGHEQVDSVGLIHMNGRVYDPSIGRFISADPFIQSPSDLQSLNRYSYVLNNPLSLTDPSGYFSLSKAFHKVTHAVGKFGKYTANPVLAARSLGREFRRFAQKNDYVAEITQIAGCAVTAAPTGGAGCVAITAAVTYAMTDGDLRATTRAAAVAFITAQVSAQIGSSYGNPELFSVATYGSALQSIGLHAALGGTMSKVQGGRFMNGAIAGGMGKAVTLGLVNSGSLYATDGGSFSNADFSYFAGRTAIAAITGGSISQMSGGSFANGAVTAAMQHLFNGELRRDNMNLSRNNGKYTPPVTRDQVENISMVLTAGTATPCSLICGVLAGALDYGLLIDSIYHRDTYGIASVILPNATGALIGTSQKMTGFGGDDVVDAGMSIWTGMHFDHYKEE